MPRTNQAIDKILATIQVRLYNARHVPEILAQLTRFHYTAERLDAGIALHQAALHAHTHQQRQYGKQYQATKALRQAHQETDLDYIYHRDLAKEIFRDDRDQSAHLRLYQRRPYYSHTKWLAQAQVFYDNLLTDDYARETYLTATHIPLADLQRARHAVEQVANLNAQQEAAKGMAQLATVDRDQALDRLQAYMRPLEITLKRAFQGKNQQALEALLMEASS